MNELRPEERARFIENNLGAPSAPVPEAIWRDVVGPSLRLSSLNSIGVPMLLDEARDSTPRRWEEGILAFLWELWGAGRVEEWAGYSCGSATLGNLQALLMAQATADAQARRLVVLATPPAHYSLAKWGPLASAKVRVVDDLSEHPVPSPSELYLYWVTFGDTHAGAFPLPPGRGQTGACLTHVDAAYGGLLVGLDGVPALDLRHVDSLVVDFHKTGRLPLTRSFFAARHDLWSAYSGVRAYIPGGRDRTVLGSRPLNEIAEMARYAQLVGVVRHRAWLEEVGHFAAGLEVEFRRSAAVRSVERRANLLLVAFQGPDVPSLCARFNISRQWLQDGYTDSYRIFCWPQLTGRPYRALLQQADASAHA